MCFLWRISASLPVCPRSLPSRGTGAWEDLQVGDQGVNGIEAWTLAEVKPTSSANSTSGRNQELGTKRVHFFPKMGRFAKGGKQEGSRTSGGRWREAEREGSRAWREYLERKCRWSCRSPVLPSPTPRGARPSLVWTSMMLGSLPVAGCKLRKLRAMRDRAPDLLRDRRGFRGHPPSGLLAGAWDPAPAPASLPAALSAVAFLSVSVAISSLCPLVPFCPESGGLPPCGRAPAASAQIHILSVIKSPGKAEQVSDVRTCRPRFTRRNCTWKTGWQAGLGSRTLDRPAGVLGTKWNG